jgi:hypothetical protein
MLENLQGFVLIIACFIINNFIYSVAERSVFGFYLLNSSTESVQFLFTITQTMASFKKVSVERSTLIIPLIDNTDIVFILQPHLVKGSTHIFLLLDELSLKLFIQNS